MSNSKDFTEARCALIDSNARRLHRELCCLDHHTVAGTNTRTAIGRILREWPAFLRHAEYRSYPESCLERRRMEWMRMENEKKPEYEADDDDTIEIVSEDLRSSPDRVHLHLLRPFP